jgi:hypothetical protein
MAYIVAFNLHINIPSPKFVFQVFISVAKLNRLAISHLQVDELLALNVNLTIYSGQVRDLSK